MTRSHAQAKVRALATHSANVILGKHAKDRMLERDITNTDVFRVLRSGSVDGVPTETERGEVKVKMVLKIRGSRGKEVRFLRKQMDLTQSELGKWLGVSDQQIARYEKGSEMPGAVDSLLRALYLESIGNEIALRELLSALDEFDAPLTEKQMFVEENGVWKPKIAA